ncbi:MAG: hypothetical protein E3J37_08930 [Anaerolineales bacterium]|nr:MAG: hypothetical protein E3J37_08930 [Anaerolineales bacterium]
MKEGAHGKLRLSLDEVWDWAYCPVRVWWRRTGLAPDVAELSGHRTGEKLIRESLRSATRLYYKAANNGKAMSFGESLGLVWKHWLDTWKLGEDVTRALVDYHQLRRALLRRFEDGSITDREGKKYKRPRWTRYWREMSDTSGLSTRRKVIDGHQYKIGMARLELSDVQQYQAPIGLADAFADSMDISNRLKLPDPKGVLGVGVPMIVDLPSTQLHLQADLVRTIGKGRRPGRPSKGESGEGDIHKVEVTLMLFDEMLPAPYSLARDLRVLALGQAKLIEGKGQTKVTGVNVLHMHSGEQQQFRPQLGDGAETLEGLARAVVTGIRGGAYVPRMVCGWQACGDCEYRMLCYAERGVMELFNPPLMAQIDAAQALTRKVKGFVDGKKSVKSSSELLKSFLEFMATSPGLTTEGALWMLDNLEAEQA